MRLINFCQNMLQFHFVSCAEITLISLLTLTEVSVWDRFGDSFRLSISVWVRFESEIIKK